MVTTEQTDYINNAPVLLYLKVPAQTIAELTARYEDGGEFGWYAWVEELKNFAYWDVDSETWKEVNPQVHETTQAISTTDFVLGIGKKWSFQTLKVYFKNYIFPFVQTLFTSHTTNVSNPHAVTKTQIGLSNVDNTSDENKPVSIAQKVYIDNKTLVSVKDFGAKGDGITDDSIAINMAFENIQNKKIYFPEGTYVCLNLNITGKTNFTIFGENSKLLVKPNSAINNHTLYILECENFIIKDLIIDGNIDNVDGNQEAGVVGIRVRESYNYLFENVTTQNSKYGVNSLFGVENARYLNCRFLNMDVGLMLFLKDDYLIPCKNIRITNCFFDGGTSEGIALYSSATSKQDIFHEDIYIENCVFINKSANASTILCGVAKNVYIKNNTFKLDISQNANAITIGNTNLEYNTDIFITNNTIQGFERFVFSYNGTSNVFIESNTILETLNPFYGNFSGFNITNNAIYLRKQLVLLQNVFTLLKSTLSGINIISNNTINVYDYSECVFISIFRINADVRCEISNNIIVGNYNNGSTVDQNANYKGIFAGYGTGTGYLNVKGNINIIRSLIQSNVFLGDVLMLDTQSSTIPSWTHNSGTQALILSDGSKYINVASSDGVTRDISAIRDYSKELYREITIICTDGKVGVKNVVTGLYQYKVKNARTLEIGEIVRFVNINNIYEEI